METSEIINDLNIVTSNYDFIYTIADITLKDFCGTVDQLTRRRGKETLNYNEYAFVVGLWIKNATTNSDKYINYNTKYSNDIYHLMGLLHECYVNKMRKPFDKDLTVSEQMMDGDKFKELFFYSGLNSYDSLYIQMLSQKYKLDEKWISDNMGFSIDALIDFYNNISNLLSRKLNNYMLISNVKNQVDGSLNVFCLNLLEITRNREDFKKILDQFSIEIESGYNEHLNDIGDFNQYYSKPIVKLNNNKYFVSTPYSLAETIYESPFYWMNQDNGYSSKSLKNRGEVGENITHEQIVRIFGDDNVFKSVKIMKNKSTTITDIDVLLLYKNISFIFQIKSKKLTNLSKNGDIVSIKKDFHKAVESAYIQGKQSEECIINSSEYDFITHESININNRIEQIKRIYIICVVLDVYPGITHSTQLFLNNKNLTPTISFTTLDLMIICKYLNKPNKFIDYITKRIDCSEYFHANSELAYLGFYFKHDLKKLKKYDMVYIEEDYGAYIDRMYYNSEFQAVEKNLNLYNSVGRNEKCPCGSGKKYKHCHMLTQ